MSSFEFKSPTKEQMGNVIEKLGLISEGINNLANPAPWASMLNGENYRPTMRAWIASKGGAALSDFTELLYEWYRLTQQGWEGGVRFGSPDQGDSSYSSGSLGTKLGDNEGLTCTPSTDSTAGTDDYQDIPMFIPLDCNWYLDENGKLHVTAIEGICGAFDRYTVGKHVGVIQQTPMFRHIENADGSYEEWITDTQKPGYIPFPDAVELDGTVRSFVVHSKYAAGDDLDSISGVPIRCWDVSHNASITQMHNAWGSQYGGKTQCDDFWLILMLHIKYASLSNDQIMAGCISYYYQINPAVAEENTNRIIVSVANGNNLLVGSTICLGSAGYGAKSAQCSVIDRKKITKKTTVTIDSVDYTAIYVDNGGVAFTTTTALVLTTMMWYTGSTDHVLGVDGSIGSNGNGRYPFRLQGIEAMNGAWEVLADTIIEYHAVDGVNSVRAAACRDASKYATSITSDYVRSESVACPASAGWIWIKKLLWDRTVPELVLCGVAGASSTTWTRDAQYTLSQASGLRECLSLGTLDHGSDYGLSCLDLTRGLAITPWNLAGRLSASGNRRGELAA